MSKFVVISTNCNPDYMYHVPITMWAWQKFGWTPVLVYVNEGKEWDKLFSLIHANTFLNHERIFIRPIDGYRAATVAQVSRLYAHGFLDEAMGKEIIMTADADMVPLSNYWNPIPGEKTVYGYDLTGFKEYPICFIAMTKDDWQQVIPTGRVLENSMSADLSKIPKAKSDDFYEWWGVDQQLITQRLKPFNPTIINRGQYPNGYARGRVDRGAWSLNHSEFIDCHMFQQLCFKQNQDKFDKTMELLTSIWPDEDFTWFLTYTNEFRRLTGHA